MAQLATTHKILRHIHSYNYFLTLHYIILKLFLHYYKFSISFFLYCIHGFSFILSVQYFSVIMVHALCTSSTVTVMSGVLFFIVGLVGGLAGGVLVH